MELPLCIKANEKELDVYIILMQLDTFEMMFSGLHELVCEVQQSKDEVTVKSFF